MNQQIIPFVDSGAFKFRDTGPLGEDAVGVVNQF